MRREGTIEEISDGKFYTANDMVKAGCNDCAGCSSCCKTVGNTIILDPYDIYSLTVNLKTSFMELLNGKIELNVVDGVILPNIKMADGGCGFLDENERCSIHTFRPGFCRLYPLGRYYEDGGFKYILLKDECRKQNRTKVKVKTFLGVKNLKEYEQFVTDWHYFLKDVEKKIMESMSAGDDERTKKISMSVLQTFYIEPYAGEDFYMQYYARRKNM